MIRIVCDPTSGSMVLYLTEIIRSGSQMFVVCLVGVGQRNFEPVVCVYSTTGWELVSIPSYRTALHSLMTDHIRSETRWSNF